MVSAGSLDSCLSTLMVNIFRVQDLRGIVQHGNLHYFILAGVLWMRLAPVRGDLQLMLAHGVYLILCNLCVWFLSLKYVLFKFGLYRGALFDAFKYLQVDTVGKVKATLVLFVSLFFNLWHKVRKVHFGKGFLTKLLICRFKHVC
jgi:hypothetical protein